MGPASTTAISHLKLYHFPMTRSARVRWLLHEILDDDFEIQREVEPQLIARLERDGFGAGERFSAVDCVLGHNIRWARLYDICGHEAFSRYLQRLEERPAYRTAFDDVGDFTLQPPGRRGRAARLT